MSTPPDTPRIVAPGSTPVADLGGFGIDWKIDGDDTHGHFSVVHHPIAPHTLAAPLHRHTNEDEYSYVIEGTLSALLGDDVVHAEAGSWVHKPRGQWHTFWNGGDTRCTIIEVIAPAGFEDFFRETAEVWGDPEGFMELCQRYQVEMRMESVPELCQRFGLTAPDPSG